jgi:hypothetical protein
MRHIASWSTVAYRITNWYRESFNLARAEERPQRDLPVEAVCPECVPTGPTPLPRRTRALVNPLVGGSPSPLGGTRLAMGRASGPRSPRSSLSCSRGARADGSAEARTAGCPPWVGSRVLRREDDWAVSRGETHLASAAPNTLRPYRSGGDHDVTTGSEPARPARSARYA